MTTPRAGRPIGSGLDDEAALDAVEALMAAEPELSQRAAIVRISGDADADLRRLQRKLSFRAQARAGDARRLLAEPFEHGEVHRGRLWAWIVEVSVPGSPPFAVAMATFVGQPVLEVVDVETEMPFEVERRPSHPIVLAIRKLPRGYDWDDPSYRICCERLGVDPDLERPARYETQIAAATAIFGGSPDASIAEGEAGRNEGAAAGSGDDQADLPLLDASWFEEPADEAETARRLAREAHWQVVADGMAFDLTPRGTYDPQRLSELHSRCHDADAATSRQTADEARRAFDSVDWSKASAFTDLRWLANPWTFDHHASIHLFGTAHDSISSWSGHPEFVAPCRKGDLVARRAALAAERNFMAVVLSEEEVANFEAGGDRAYWLSVNNWHTSRWGRLRAKWTAPDLSMTSALIDAMISNACEAYASRASGEVLVPTAELSCERRQPIAPSSMRSFLQVVLDTVADRWRMGRFRRAAARGACFPCIHDGRLHLPWGDCFIGRAEGRVIVRPGAYPLEWHGHSVRLSVDLVESFDGTYLPLVADHGFEATDVRTGRPVAPDLLRGILALVAMGARLVPPVGGAQSVPMRRKAGWAAAGFGACLLAFTSFAGTGQVGGEMRSLPPGAMPTLDPAAVRAPGMGSFEPIPVRTTP